MKFINYFVLLILQFSYASCTDNIEDTNKDTLPTLVVEGWIDSDGRPFVHLTRAISLDEDRFMVDENTLIEQWAKVTVSDGSKEVVLIGFHDTNFYPPYVYTTSDIKGEIGKTYKLTVDCLDGTHAEAYTTIPSPTEIDSFRVDEAPLHETEKGEIVEQRKLTAFIHPVEDIRYYKAFVYEYSDNVYGYKSSYLGLANSSMLNNIGEMTIYNGVANLDIDKATVYFPKGSTVKVRLATIDEETFKFWEIYEEEVNLRGNPLLSSANNLPSNVNGALGYWFGYGVSSYNIVMDDLHWSPLVTFRDD